MVAIAVAVLLAALSAKEAGSIECVDLCPGAQQGSSTSIGNPAYCHSSAMPGHPLRGTRGTSPRSLRDKNNSATSDRGRRPASTAK